MTKLKKIPSALLSVGLLVVAPLFVVITRPSPAQAVHKEVNGCGSGSTLAITPNGLFEQPCNNHDRCYGIIGKTKGECDKQFHNEMLEICARNFHTWITKPARIACNGNADVYYTAVLEYASKAYTDAQNHALQEQNEPVCRSVDSRKGWQSVTLPGTFTRVTSVSGSWSVDDRNYRRVGPEGHSEPGLEPYNQYKYDKGYSFGALLVDIPTQSYGYIRASGAQQLPQPISQTSMRINDSDDSLGDNGGALNVCFGR